MKGNLEFLRKIGQKVSLHMKRKKIDSKIEKYLNFSKMDKKNVQNWIAEKVLTDENFCYDVENLSSQTKS
jgi:hypothetical protein